MDLDQKLKSHKKQPKIIKEFAEFINRGNVVDLAVGVIVGGAFSKIVTSLVNDIIMPVASFIAGGINLTSLEITIPNIINSSEPARITYGNFLQNIVDFLIVAACVFFFVRIMNRLSSKKDAKLAAEKAAEKAADAADKKTEESTDAEILKTLKSIDKKLSPKSSK